MVFSFLTSYLLGERLDKPIQAVMGSLMVTFGVIICMFAGGENESELPSGSVGGEL